LSRADERQQLLSELSPATDPLAAQARREEEGSACLGELKTYACLGDHD
jgi:hypothetical protein